MAELEWTRPETVPYPSVWKVVDGTKPLENGKIPRFRIQDVAEDLYEEVLEHMLSIFIRDEPYSAHLKIKDSTEAMEEVKSVYYYVMSQKLAIVALLDNPEDFPNLDLPRVAGVNMTLPVWPGKESPKPVTKHVSHLVNFMMALEVKCNFFKKYNVPVIMTAYGLSVHPIFRGQSLGEHILRTRVDLGKAVGIRLTTTIFTNVRAQAIAKKVGFQFEAEADPLDYRDEEGKIVFDGENCKIVQALSLVLQ